MCWKTYKYKRLIHLKHIRFCDSVPGPEGGGTGPPFLLQTTMRQTVVRTATAAQAMEMEMRMAIRGTLDSSEADQFGSGKKHVRER